MASSPTVTQHSMANEIAKLDPFTPPHQTAPSSPTYSDSPDFINSGDSFATKTAGVKPNRRGQPKRNRITDSFTSHYDKAFHALARKNAREDPSLQSNTEESVNAIGKEHLLRRKKKSVPVLSEWIGTSLFNIDEGIAIQKCGVLKSLINYRNATLHDIPLAPYHPHFYIELSRVDNKLGFCDIGAANAYRALALIKAGLGITKKTYPEILGDDVCSCVEWRLKYEKKSTVIEELEDLRLYALRELLRNMLGSGAFWEGLLEAKEALKLFPRDSDLIEARDQLKDAFEGKCRGFTSDPEDVEGMKAIVASTRRGTIYQKPYPWLDKELYIRSPALVKEVNENFAAVNCEVRQVIFHASAAQIKTPTENEDEDVGPLGVFATNDISEGDLLMVDCFFTGMSDVPSSHLTHCDGCHSSVCKPYMHPDDAIKPRCCGKVVYCGMECYEAAINGYHKIVCGKDFDWLYKDIKGKYNKKVAGEHWRSILFLRIMCLILSDRLKERQSGEQPTHPLQHPLVIRMTAKYASRSKFHPNHYSDWVYADNVATPHRILEQLNVNVFTSSEFTPEVIQTIYWRLENNASQSTVNLSDVNRHNRASSGTATCVTDDKQEVHLLCVNPNYIFFNHSCEPNVDWHGSNPNPWLGISWLKSMSGDIIQPGCSAVWCIAARDIKKGEELKISYVGDATGKDDLDRQKKRYMMEKWFEGGCGCNICVRENETGKIGEEESQDGGNDDESEAESGENDDEDSEDSEIDGITAQMDRLI